MMLLYCVGFLLLAGNCLAYTVYSNGTGPVDPVWCNGKICAANASCVNNTCVCDQPPYTKGYGYGCCITEDEDAVILASDPILTTFDGNKGDLPVPCRYSVTWIKTDFPLQTFAAHAGQCYFTVRAFNRKHKGKIYVYGFDLSVRILYTSTSPLSVRSFVVRKRGIAENGQYTYLINATENASNIDGPYGNDDINYSDPSTGLHLIECFIDHVFNLAEIKIAACGFHLKFRAYDILERRNQTMVPGLGVAVNHNNNPLFGVQDEYVAMVPANQAGHVDISTLPPINGTNTAKFVYRALTSGVPQNLDDPNTECNGAGDALKLCNHPPTLLSALDRCLWMFQTPKFINCFDPTKSGVKITELFKDCVGTVCSTVNLTEVVSEVRNSKCEPNNVNVQNFVLIT